MSSKKISNSFCFSIILIALLCILDQFTKILMVSKLSLGEHFVLIDGILEFFYIQNTGAAFSFLTGHTWVFLVATPFILAIIIFILIRLPKETRFLPIRMCIIFILAGAIGNWIDRITLGYVRDFIYFSLIDFPVFNVADIYVTCAIFVMVFLFMFYYKEEELDRVITFKSKNNKNNTES